MFRWEYRKKFVFWVLVQSLSRKHPAQLIRWVRKTLFQRNVKDNSSQPHLITLKSDIWSDWLTCLSSILSRVPSGSRKIHYLTKKLAWWDVEGYNNKKSRDRERKTLNWKNFSAKTTNQGCCNTDKNIIDTGKATKLSSLSLWY